MEDRTLTEIMSILTLALTISMIKRPLRMTRAKRRRSTSLSRNLLKLNNRRKIKRNGLANKMIF